MDATSAVDGKFVEIELVQKLISVIMCLLYAASYCEAFFIYNKTS